jgi:hypothetical protein
MGTFEEFCEVVTWGQLGLHAKPCCLLNTDGYFDPMLSLFDRGVEEGFIKPTHRKLVLTGRTPDEVLAAIKNYTPIVLDKWIDRAAT